MIENLGEKLTYTYLKYMPNAFVFAILLTLITVLGAYLSMEITLFLIFSLATEIVLIMITGYSIALSHVRKYYPNKKAYRLCYVEDPFGIVLEINMHS